LRPPPALPGDEPSSGFGDASSALPPRPSGETTSATRTPWNPDPQHDAIQPCGWTKRPRPSTSWHRPKPASQLPEIPPPHPKPPPQAGPRTPTRPPPTEHAQTTIEQPREPPWREDERRRRQRRPRRLTQVVRRYDRRQAARGTLHTDRAQGHHRTG
jgi:hypothetical protein